MKPNLPPRSFWALASLCATLSMGALHAGDTATTRGTAISDKPAPAAGPSVIAPGWWDGPSLTDDWFQQGAEMRKHGVFIQSELTQFGQGLVGGKGSKDWEYGGKLDTFWHFEGQMMGTWKGLSLDAHTEFVFGRNVNANGGTLAPVNTALLLPASNEELFTISSLFLTQKLFDDYLALSVGRFNTVDFYAQNWFDGGRGITSFWNIAFAGPPIFARTVTPVMNGAIIKVDTKKCVDFTFGVFDSRDDTTTTGLPQLFDVGVTVLAEVGVKTKIFNLDGQHQLTGTWSNLEANSLSNLRQVLLPRLFGTAESKDSTWALYYHFDQYVYEFDDTPGKVKGVGLFGSVGVSDGNPNPIKWSATIGFGGSSPIPCRQDDRFGVAYYYFGLSHDLLSNRLAGDLLREEQGMETFYTFAVNKWWDITADVQVIDPATTRNQTDVVLGMSTRLKF